MKYPEYRLSMEAALPSSVHSWLKLELEQRGIDSHVYTRYIIHLLLQNEDLDCETDLVCPFRAAGKKKGRKLGRKQFSISDEERKKSAAIECLADLSEEKSDIISLIDELCLKLKDSEAQATVSPVIKSNSSGSESSEDSGTENQNSTERYYAAFPSLHGKSSPTSASSSVAVESVWKNNPLVKPHPGTLTSPEDSSGSNDDLEVKKIIKSSTLIIPKHKKTRKNTSRNKKEFSEHRKSRSHYQKQKTSSGSQNKAEPMVGDTSIQNWPPGFARLDPLVQYDTFGEEVFELRTETPKRQNEELCTKVECILKGMLLPTPEKTYKDLQDVDTEVIEVQREKSHNTSHNRVDASKKQQEQNENTEQVQLQVDLEPVERESSVSPELQEQEIWYTQPIGAILLSPEEEKGGSKLRLYKRNSYPLFSPQGSEGQAPAADCAADSSASSPAFDRSRSYSASSTDSDSILEGSVFMPSWLTEEISADPDEEASCDVQNMGLSTSFHSSSPFFDDQEAISKFSKSLESTLTFDDAGWGEAAFSFPPSLASSDHMALESDQYNPWSINSDENLTPTPDEANTLEVDECDFGGQLSVSLVDWDYLSHFSHESEMPTFYLEDGLRRSSLQRTCLSSLSQSHLVFDFSLDVPDYGSPQFGMFGIYWWQSMWNEENGFSQLWDVNMQKRSKVSPLGCPSFLPVSQVWLAENTFVFYNNNFTDKESTDGQEENENTLIPRISIDLMAEPSIDSLHYSDKSDEDIDNLRANFARSVSVVDVPAVWDETMEIRGPDPKLSKSFELVPSETSAFCDVPRKLIHVHSEPNLVKYRQEFNEGNVSRQQSPQEHLYFSPKTHFRPITPAFAPELSQSKAKHQVCHDLFGGLPATKTPYQQYHTCDEGSDEDSFIPKFKLKNYCKSIQTGDEEEKVESPAQSCESPDRDTPQTLTLGLIEEIMGSKDDGEFLFPISEDLDTANTDSAYETDYGLSAMESEQDDNSKPLHFNCTNRGKQDSSYSGSLAMSSSIDHGNLGDRMNYSLDSFMATFPHTQDWPDISQSCHFSSGPADWSDTEGHFHMASSWPALEVLPRQPVEPELPQEGPDDVFLMDSCHDSWLADMFCDHHSDSTDTDKYKQVWTTGDEDTDPGSTLEAYNFDFSNYHKEFDTHFVCGESSPQALFPGDGLDFPCSDCSSHPREALTEGQSEIETDRAGKCHPIGSVGPGGEGGWTNSGEYFSVKLVYKDKQDQDNTPGQKSYGSFDLMPMPGEAVLSTELEKEWMDPNSFLYKPSSMQRKPCSFYLEGNCRRTDCKFAHDISNITCRFWEEGDCFKGPLCPFLHGYPRITSPAVSPDEPEIDLKDNFNLNNNEEFPELTLTVKNGNHVSKKVTKPVKSVSTTKRDRSRKSSARRHSNKENKAESRLMDKCSTSV